MRVTRNIRLLETRASGRRGRSGSLGCPISPRGPRLLGARPLGALPALSSLRALELPRAPTSLRALASARAPTSLLALAALAVCLAIQPAPVAGQDALRAGNEAFRAGKYDEAAKLYESEEERGGDLLTRRFNAGVSHLRSGALDRAAERFEDVSSRAEGKLQSDAFYNAGYAHFQKAKAVFEAALKPAPGGDAKKAEPASPQEKLKTLAEAAKSYRAAADFFRRVSPQDEATERNIGVVKTSLRAVLDEMARVEAEEKKKADEEALKSPPELLRALLAKERLHRSVCRSLEGQPGGKVRLGARRLRKSTAESRALAEKLHHYLTKPPEGAAAPGAVVPGTAAPGTAAPGAGAQKEPSPPSPSDEESARNARAAEALQQAIEAQKDAEVAYGKLDPASAVSAHTRAIAELRKAREALPLDIGAVIEEALSTQEGIHGALEKMAEARRAGLPEDVKGSGVGKTLVEAIRDKVLLPVAKLIAPKQGDQARALGEEEEEVVWGSQILSAAEIPPTPQGAAMPPGQPGLPQAGPQGNPQAPILSAEDAKALSEGLREEGKKALEAATKAKDELAQARVEEALPHSAEARDALRRAADLLPKPPEPPEARLRKLIEKQRQAREATEGLSGLDAGIRDTARVQIVTGQRASGKEAAGIAEELEKRQDEPAKKAAPKVREGEGQVYASGEALVRERIEEAKSAVDRDIRAFEEALALLEGKDQEKGEQQQDEKQNQEKNRKDQDDEKKRQEKEQNRYALSPLEAKALQDELDRQRREEEKAIFVPRSDMTVEKDW